MTAQAEKLIARVKKMEAEEFARLRKKQQQKLLDDMWSLLIRTYGGWKCATAGLNGVNCSNIFQGAHLITRGAWPIRYHLRNGRCLCSAHHTYYTFRPAIWEEICRSLFHSDYVDLTGGKWSSGKNDYVAIYEDFRKRIV